MASIRRTLKEDQSLTILTVHGTLTCDEVIATLDALHGNEVPLHLLWDMREADVSKITREDMDQIVAAEKQYVRLHGNGKTACVVQSELAFGRFRMYDALAELAGLTNTRRVFRSMDDAVRWLEPDRLP